MKALMKAPVELLSQAFHEINSHVSIEFHHVFVEDWEPREPK